MIIVKNINGRIIYKDTKGGIKTKSQLADVNAMPKKDEGYDVLSHFAIFEKCINRANNLLSIHDSTEKIPEVTDEHYYDCYRSAVVLSISALDAFVRKIIISEIRNKLADKNTKISESLSSYIKEILKYDELLESARGYTILDKVSEKVKADFETKSFQGDRKINQFFDMVGYKNIFETVSKKADVSEPNLRRKINLFTTRRHIIAHSGDYDLNQNPHKENKIDKKYANECLNIVSLIAKNIHDIIEDK